MPEEFDTNREPLKDKPKLIEQPLKLRMVEYNNNGSPYTAFVALNDDEYGDVMAAGTGNLTDYKDKILLVVDGHSPDEKLIQGVRDAFRRIYRAGPAATNS